MSGEAESSSIIFTHLYTPIQTLEAVEWGKSKRQQQDRIEMRTSRKGWRDKNCMQLLEESWLRVILASTREALTCHYCFSVTSLPCYLLKLRQFKKLIKLLACCLWGWTTIKTCSENIPYLGSITLTPSWSRKHNWCFPLGFAWDVTNKTCVWKLWLSLFQRFFLVFVANNMQTMCNFVYKFVATVSCLST